MNSQTHTSLHFSIVSTYFKHSVLQYFMFNLYLFKVCVCKPMVSRTSTLSDAPEDGHVGRNTLQDKLYECLTNSLCS
jgi:hypothetical protein